MEVSTPHVVDVVPPLTDHPECPPTTMARLLYVADLMVNGAWVRGDTAPELAAHWGLATSTVEDYSSEASRWVKSMVDPEEVKQKLGFYLSKNLRIADGNPREVAEVAKAYAPLVGLGDKAQVNILFDQRTNQLRPEARAFLDASDEEVMTACEAAVLDCGWSLERFQAAVAARLDGVALIEAKP